MDQVIESYFEKRFTFKNGYNSEPSQFKMKGKYSEVKPCQKCNLVYETDLIFCLAHNRVVWKKLWKASKDKKILQHNRRVERNYTMKF